MKNVDDLITSAAELADHGLPRGEIAGGLDVSHETVNWLAGRGGAVTEPKPRTEPEGPGDIYVNWNVIGSGGKYLTYVGHALADLLMGTSGKADVTVGVKKAGVPFATPVSRELGTMLGAYSPTKHQQDEDDLEDLGDGFSRNFPPVEGYDCFIVDNMMTSGATLRETIDTIHPGGGEPLVCVVVVDKQGVEGIGGIPVYSLINVVRAGK